ncbi:RagB/SusD family nutrient uptake outer membrane protein [Niabella drilacis]|uniref:Starch-binding associating with outer membrane n=1 Tax=Niabella drilacis (strain DSM 25811 / CCM 8410 / CCUG 62505 / LMG 26954 / E90) TaxID=1285928 RepID=A0A1G6PYZ4_NIADE|nr:RagB/SusD family nutrient uptake outer membrane protein [Niabella drilacis]SDC85309.1 Starch-binding associating with outer membrane [Niabella drilacis]
MKHYIVALFSLVTLFSCGKKLDIYPTNAMTPGEVYKTTEGYKGVLAKIYATLSGTGNQGPAGDPDIGGGLDEGSQVPFIRAFFNAQELPTDEAVVAWNDQTIQDFHNLKVTSGDPFLKGMYARPIWNITLINEYIRQTSDSAMKANGISDADAAGIKATRGEARFMRAFNYWVMLDLFGKSTFITEADPIGYFLPREISRKDLFAYIETELKTALTELPPAKTVEYGRVDQGAANALLARLYLNAVVYTGTPKYTEAITYAKNVINAGYKLADNYRSLFMADNNINGRDEFIFTANCDGLTGKAYGNTTFFIHAAAGDDNKEFGANSGWFGYRATKGLAVLFPDLSGNTDKRAMFKTSKFDATLNQAEIDDVTNFTNGLHVNKYRNIRLDGGEVSDPNSEFADIDFPIIRLPELYLIYAEAVLRGGTGGDLATARSYVNLIRSRAGATSINLSDLTLQFVLDERGRELYWESHRRTDLVRYNLLTTGTYLWPWKGGVASGTAVNSKYNIYPVPAANISSNSNLSQNNGY